MGGQERWPVRPAEAVAFDSRASTHAVRRGRFPPDPDVTYVCAVGQLYKTHRERGVYKTTDGGQSWTQSLFLNEETGCSDLTMDPRDPQTLYAGTWQISIHTWNLTSGGPGSGVSVTHDGGATWTKLAGHGLPSAGATIGKVAVVVAPSNPNRPRAR